MNLTRRVKPRLADVCCCQGGASRGYADAGFDVTGVDIDPQPRYPFPFIQMDALKFLEFYLKSFNAVAISPPCQAHTLAQRIQGNEHADLIEPARALLETYRHRLFETGGGFSFAAPAHPEHVAKTTKMGRRRKPGEFMHIVGNFTGVDEGRKIMGMPWASRDGLREAIPPAYTKYIGERLMAYVTGREDVGAA